MSYHDRAGENANSAIIVTVTPEDFCGMETGAGTDQAAKRRETPCRNPVPEAPGGDRFLPGKGKHTGTALR